MPAGQALQAVEPESEYWPFAHLVQEAWPLTGWKLPAAHLEQPFAPVASGEPNQPGAQALQEVAEAAGTDFHVYPIAHGAGAFEFVCVEAVLPRQKLSSGHGKHRKAAALQ